MPSNRAIGAQGEEIAKEFLQCKGYSLLAQNYTIWGGEIDLVMMDKQTLVFIEVKARTSNFFGRPEDSVTPTKVKFLNRSIEKYMVKNGYNVFDTDCRIDFVGIDLYQHKKPNIQHIPNAFVFDDF